MKFASAPMKTDFSFLKLVVSGVHLVSIPLRIRARRRTHFPSETAFFLPKWWTLMESVHSLWFFGWMSFGWRLFLFFNGER